MEDGKAAKINDDGYSSLPIVNSRLQIYPEVTSNGHDFPGESSYIGESNYKINLERSLTDKNKKRINPLKIHLARNSSDHTIYNIKPSVTQSDLAPDSYHQTFNRNYLKNAPSKSAPSEAYHNFPNANRHQKPSATGNTPKHLPKHNVAQNKKSKIEKAPQHFEAQPTVKFKCRKCCSMSFKSLSMLKEHQRMCRSQVREPALSPEGMSGSQTTNSNNSSGRVTKKVYLCSACSTYYENWNLFLHMREVHNRHICLFCLGMFSKAEKLSAHLMNKHNVQENWFNTEQEFTATYKGPMYIMCCSCDQIFTEKDNFSIHDCGNIKPIPVPVLIAKSSRNLAKVATNKPLDTSLNGPTSNIDLTHEKSRPSNAEKLEPVPNKIKLKINLHDKCVIRSDYPPINKETIKTDSEITLQKKSCYETDNLNSQHRMDASCDKTMHGGYWPNDLVSKKLDDTGPSEKPNCGIKLTLSLNKSQSPVIINSTVDPSVGRQSGQKYSNKFKSLSSTHKNDVPVFTNCNEYNISSDNKCRLAETPETLDKLKEKSSNSACVSPVSTIKSTIYDNKPEDLHNINRVPKLTVRVPKELLDKDSSSDYSIDSDASDKLTVDDSKNENENLIQPSDVDESREKCSPSVLQTTSLTSPQIIDTLDKYQLPASDTKLAEKSEISQDICLTDEPKSDVKSVPDSIKTEKDLMLIQPDESTPKPSIHYDHVPNSEIKPFDMQQSTNSETFGKLEEKDIVVDMDVDDPPDIRLGKDDIPVVELKLDRPLDKYPLKDLLKVFIASTMYNCIYCNHARLIAVNCYQLSLHMNLEHKFSATVDSITAEELLPDKISSKVETDANELKDVYINLETYDSVDKIEVTPSPLTYECFKCYYKTSVHKELYSHNRKMHQKTILLCVMCKSNFYSYSELLCHLCPGAYESDYEIKFRCCMCTVDRIPSAFRLMVHLRKVHNACDVCIESCFNQARLSNHVWKHKLHHLCYRCGIAYRNKPDITKHLFWKHGTESVVCKKCLQKKWPHVYHFCIPPATFICDECNLNFTRAVSLKVHKRLHSEDFPHLCTEPNCIEKFVSKKLLEKHLLKHSTTDIIDITPDEKIPEAPEKTKEAVDEIPTIDLVDDGDKTVETNSNETLVSPAKAKKSKKRKGKDKDMLPEVNLPELQLSESDSSDDSDSALPTPKLISTNIENREDSIVDDTANRDIKNEKLCDNDDTVNLLKTETRGNIKIDEIVPNTPNNCSKEENEPVKELQLKESNDKDNMNDIKQNTTASVSDKELQTGDKLDLEKVEAKADHKPQNANGTVLENKLDLNKPGEFALDNKSANSTSEVLEGFKSEIKENIKSINEELNTESSKSSKTTEQKTEEEKANEQKVLDIWNNFQKYQASVEKTEKAENPKIKSTPLVPIRKHVCESEHDYCLIPQEINGDDENDKKKKKSPRKTRAGSSSSSSSSSDSDSSCSCGSNCSCSSSSGSSSSSSSDSDSSLSGKEKKKRKRKRKDSNGSAVDVTAMVDTPVLIPEPREPAIAESDLETDETETDEDFYDEHPQRLANKMYAEKRNQLMLLASVAPSDTGSAVDESSRPPSPIKEKQPSSKKKSKTRKKKKSKDSQKHKPIKINIPKNIISTPEILKSCNETPEAPNKITISLQSNTVQMPQLPNVSARTYTPPVTSTPSAGENKRASKRKRVPNKFYGYSSDEESSPALKQYQPPKLEWRKEDLPSPSVNKSKKEDAPAISLKFPTYSSFRYTAPITDPVPPQNFMNESLESSDSDSSEEGALEICQPSPRPGPGPGPCRQRERERERQRHRQIPRAPAHLSAGTSSLPYAFVRPPQREARAGESVYCYCRCPYDEVSEMIACDAAGCAIEWFHFECVGIMVPPKGKWYCPDCRQRAFATH